MYPKTSETENGELTKHKPSVTELCGFTQLKEPTEKDSEVDIAM